MERGIGLLQATSLNVANMVGIGPFITIPLLMTLQSCSSTVNPGSRGLRWYPLTSGLAKEPLKEGFYWRAPWNDVLVYDTRWKSFREKVDALTADDLPVTVYTRVSAFAGWIAETMSRQ